jgi:hypothetical protein
MPGASQQPIPPALEALDAELKARQALDRAHAIFHVKPSEAHAASVADALSAWRALSPSDSIAIASAAALVELERQVDSDELDHGLWTNAKLSGDAHDVNIDGRINLTKIVAAALAAVGA